MKFWKYALSSLGATLLLAACGGGGSDQPNTGAAATTVDITAYLNLPVSGAGGGVVTSTLTITNSSNATATSVVGNVVLSNGDTRSFNVPSLPPSASSVQSFATTLPNDTATTVLLGTATVATANPESNRTNNSSTDTLAILYADPTISVNPMLAGVAGNTVTATISLGNSGSATVTFTPLAVVNGVTQTLAAVTLLPGQTSTATVQVPVTSNGATVTAIVSSASVADLNLANNRDTKFKPVFTGMVNFGDSLSDVGTYKVGTIAAVGGGQWTVNSGTAKNWTAGLASKFKLADPCAAQTGLFSIVPGLTAVPVQDNAACNNYAQGSSRVTSAFGPNSVAIQQAVLGANGTAAAISAAGLGLMALPVVKQMENHATKVTSYSGNELVTVMAGGNDVFLNLNGISSAAAGGAAAAGAAAFAGWASSVQISVFAGGAAATDAAIQAAVLGMGQAGTELANAVKTQVLAKGAKYVAVVNLPDVSRTPFGISLGPQTQQLLTTMAGAFNNALATGLVGESRVIVVDAFTQSVLQASFPTQFSLTNVLTPACDASATTTNILGGSALTCTASNTLANVDVSRYLFADSVHLTPFGNQLLADFVDSKLVAAGWR